MSTFNVATTGQVGLWIHQAETALGKLHDIAALGFAWIAPKMLEDGSLYGDVAAFKQLCADAATIGLPVVPWGYSRPREIDAQIAVVSANLPTNAAGIIIDAEVEWETGGSFALAHQLCHGIAEAIEHRAPLHLSSFYDPALHPQFPYTAFLTHCQSFMPQSYVEGGTPASLVIGRTMLSAYTLASQSGRALVPTVNTISLLPLLKKAGDYGCSVWLLDGDPGTSDAGVIGFEDAWKAALAVYKS